jgi:hypothetical protein
MVRLQGDFAKPPEKRFNYKHCFDALFRVSCTPALTLPFGFAFEFVSSPFVYRSILFLSLFDLLGVRLDRAVARLLPFLAFSPYHSRTSLTIVLWNFFVDGP